MRALKIKNENRIDDALKLFSELLETQVLHEVSCHLPKYIVFPSLILVP